MVVTVVTEATVDMVVIMVATVDWDGEKDRNQDRILILLMLQMLVLNLFPTLRLKVLFPRTTSSSMHKY